jgi:hypothetical protein
MRYLLVVGFYCDVYRKEPQARLFFNDQLIDEFNIQNCLENRNLKSPHGMHPFPFPSPAQWHPASLEPISTEFRGTNNNKALMTYHSKSLPTLRLYEVEINNQLKKSSIRIDIDNDDNNYNNGFMTRYTRLQFNILVLVPLDKKIYNWFLKKSYDARNTDRYAWHRRDCINNFFIGNYLNIYSNITWTGKNGEKIDGSKVKFMGRYTIGSGGSLHCELIRKYGILLPKLIEIKRPYIYKTQARVIEYIYDKYERYANQRNTD